MDFLRLHMKKVGRSTDNIEAVSTTVTTAITVTTAGATTTISPDRESRRSHNHRRLHWWYFGLGNFDVSTIHRNNCIRATWNTVCEFITSNLVDHKAVEFRGLKTTWPESKKAEVALPDAGSVYFTVFFASETTVI
jgi:hypothetical protein